VNAGDWSVVAAVAALAAVRAWYPVRLERRHARMLPVNADDVIVGAEPIDLPHAGPRAALVLHGGGDTPQSVRLLAEFLHRRGYAVRAPLLAGHGRNLKSFRRFEATRWQAQVRTEFDVLRERHAAVAVVGQSVGGALALDLAAAGADVRALVLLAPWIAMPKPIRALTRTSRLWGLAFPYLPSLGGHSIHDPAARSRALTHGIVTPASLRAFRNIADIAAGALPKVSVPTLVMQSREDPRIAATDAQRAFDRLGARVKRLDWVTGAGHVISVDHGKERVQLATADWLDAYCGA
jgi:carboxylesterase